MHIAHTTKTIKKKTKTTNDDGVVEGCTNLNNEANGGIFVSHCLKRRQAGAELCQAQVKLC